MSETPPDIPPVHAATHPPQDSGPVADAANGLRPDRRRGLRVLAGSLLALLCGVPAAIAGLFALDPVLRRRRSAGGEPVRVADLSAVPDDGTPRSFSVVSDQVDGWTNTPGVEVGVVFLRKSAGGVIAWNARCPHLGCLVQYKPQEGHFLCPCHSSIFDAEGTQQNEISPRPLDALETEVRDGAVYVAYQDFKYRITEKVPVG